MAGVPDGSTPHTDHYVVAGIRCEITRTERPWELPIDAIVVSVGASLGSLGIALQEEFPSSGWRSIPFRTITPERPQVMKLAPPADGNSSLRLAVLTTSHEKGLNVTMDSIRMATGAALVAAGNAGATSIGLPLLATGVLGFPRDQAARAAVSAVETIFDAVAGGTLKRLVLRLVFFAQDEATCRVIASELHNAGTRQPEPVRTEPATDIRPPEDQPPVYSTVDLAGGVSSDLVDPNVGIPLNRDQLSFAPYVSMLATVIADRKTPPPLSVGIFGEWGAGKSYFMGLLRAQVEQLAGSGSPVYCGEIVQIGFNAWHYADSNLWASLGDEIFRQLAGPKPDAEGRRQQLRSELAERLEQRKELEAARDQASEAAARLQSQVDKATAERRTTARDLIKALRRSTTFQREVDALWRRLGVDDEIEQGILLAEQLQGTQDELDLVRRSSAGHRGRIALTAAVTVLIGCAFVAMLAPAARQWIAVVSTVSSVVGGIGFVILERARTGVRKLRRFSDELQVRLSDAARNEPEVARMLDALRRAEAHQLVAEAQLSEVVARVGALGKQLATLTPGNRLYAFLAERARSDSYSGNLGLVSTIRKDFTQLVELMADWRANPDAGGAPRQPMDRIVLYIDDLDRCNPRQVVQVLEAVHLLLALDLFVVVVGVDPRWLLRSLRSHYDEILADGSDEGHATPEDYLEKIINVPLALPSMSGLGRLLRSMAEDVESRPAPAVDAPAEGLAPAGYSSAITETLNPRISIEPRSEVDIQRDHAEAVLPRPLTEPELTLLSALDHLVDTPRKAKRLFNLYRMLRATRDLSDASRFLGDDDRAGEYQAVAVLLGLVTGCGPLLDRIFGAEPGGLVNRRRDTPWTSFVADLEPERSDGIWRNRVAGPLPHQEVAVWQALRHGLAKAPVTLPDLSCLQDWVPVIRRFSYALSPLPAVDVRGGEGTDNP